MFAEITTHKEGNTPAIRSTFTTSVSPTGRHVEMRCRQSDATARTMNTVAALNVAFACAKSRMVGMHSSTFSIPRFHAKKLEFPSGVKMKLKRGSGFRIFELQTLGFVALSDSLYVALFSLLSINMLVLGQGSTLCKPRLQYHVRSLYCR